MLVWLALIVPAASGSGVTAGTQGEETAFPPVLMAPEEAQKEATLARMSEAARAELLLLARDPSQALDFAGSAKNLEDPRRLRLMADARVQLGHVTEAETLLTKLEKYPGWRKHVERQRSAMEAIGRARTTTRTGLALYALALGALALGGARELLRPYAPTAAMLALSAVALLVARLTWPPLGLAAGIAGLGATFIVHAGAATLSRLEPGPRGRLLVVVVVVLGAVGAWAALAASLARAVWSG